MQICIFCTLGTNGLKNELGPTENVLRTGLLIQGGDPRGLSAGGQDHRGLCRRPEEALRGQKRGQEGGQEGGQEEGGQRMSRFFFAYINWGANCNDQKKFQKQTHNQMIIFSKLNYVQPYQTSFSLSSFQGYNLGYSLYRKPRTYVFLSIAKTNYLC